MPDSSQPPKSPRPVARPIMVRKKEEPDSSVEAKTIPQSATAAPTTPHARPAASVPVSNRHAKIVRAKDPEDELEADIGEVAIRNAPPWLVSLLVHLVILIALGLLMLPELLETPLILEVVYAEKLGEQLDDAVLQSPADQVPDIAEPVLSEDDMACGRSASGTTGHHTGGYCYHSK